MAHLNLRAWSCLDTFVCGFLLLALAPWAHALDITYCSPDNNSGGAGLISTIYMSNGKCQTNCAGSYVFAVIQGDNCYCSNYVPTDQVNTGSCNTPCPGYPSELCGNTDAGLYAYFNLGGTPSGTSGGTSSASSTSVSTFPSRPGGFPFASPSLVLTGSPNPVHSSVSILTSAATPQSSTKPSSLQSASSTESESADVPSTSSTSPDGSITSGTGTPTQVYTSVISVTGRVSTIVITPTSRPDSALGQSGSGKSGGGISGGTVAGIVIGVAIALGLLVGLGVWMWLRRRHQRNLEAISEGGSYASPSNASKHGNNGTPSRQVSQMSSAGLLSRIPRIQTGGLNSFPENARSAGTGNSGQDRSSTHMTVDQRLNPWAIYSNEEARASNVSLQDNQDYSRQLRVANPDP